MWSLKALTFPLLHSTRLWLTLEWCMPTNGPVKYSLRDRGNSRTYVRDIQTHVHAAAFCGWEFMGWANDKNSTQCGALWSSRLSLVTSGITVNNWAAVERWKETAEGESRRGSIRLGWLPSTEKLIYVGTVGCKDVNICTSVISIFIIYICLCGHQWFISVLSKIHFSVAVWSVLWSLPLILCSVDTFWGSVCTAFISAINHCGYRMLTSRFFFHVV